MHATRNIARRDQLLGQLAHMVPSGPNADVVPALERFVAERQLDRVSARAAWLVSVGQLDARDLRQLLPVTVGIVARNQAAAPAGALGSAVRRLTTGVTVGRYTVETLLGTGGSGAVYAARHPALGIRVAVKVVADPARAAAEVDSLRAVIHRNVPRLWDTGVSPFGSYLVLEFAGGGSLSDRLKRNRLVAPRTAFRVARQVLRGLRAAQRVGYTHGDVKPGNILRNGRDFQLADFGLAERIGGGGVPVERVYGSWSYLAPERFADAGDSRGDLYSLALTLCHLLTGQPPVAATTFAAAAREHRKLQLEPLHWTVPGVDRDQSAAIRRMAAQDPADRPTDYAELIATFRGGIDRAPESE
jgi:serine/threonine protein kinase